MVNILSKISTEVPIWDINLQRYQYMIKPTCKPKLDLNAPYEYASLQTIAYLDKPVNAYFCPIFRETFELLYDLEWVEGGPVVPVGGNDNPRPLQQVQQPQQQQQQPAARPPRQV